MKKIRILICWLLVIGILGSSVWSNVSSKKTDTMNYDSIIQQKNSFCLGNNGGEEQIYQLNEEDYYVVEDEALDDALVDYSFEDDKDSYITSLDELYGEKIEYYMLKRIAKLQIASNIVIAISNFASIKTIAITDKVLLYDANDRNTYIGFNYRIDDGNYGYITVSTHTRAPLIREIEKNKVLPCKGAKIYYLSEGEFYIESKQNYTTLEETKIQKKEFDLLKRERLREYYKYTKDLLATIELDTINMLNNAIFLTSELESVDEIACGEKSYDGQVGNGYGGIVSPSKYLKDKYGGSISKKTPAKCLSMDSFICSDFKEQNNCTLVAITRILKYYSRKGYSKIPSNTNAIYKKVLKVAKKYGYTEKNGTFPTKINNIIDKTLDEYGYPKSYSKGVYMWTFEAQVKNEIDKYRPVVMNIARGYYGNHSVTVCGYSIYQTKHKSWIGSYRKTHNMICVYDGWDRGYRYIDYEAFAYDLIASGFGSFNTITMKR